MTGFVYAIAAGDTVKIGWSISPKRRLAKIQSDNPTECVLVGVTPGTRDDEDAAQKRLRPWRIRREWFRQAGAVLDFLATLEPLPVNRRPYSGTGHPLGRYRHDFGLSMDDVAKAAQTTRQSIFRIEKGGQTPSLGLVGRLIAASEGKLSADDFLPPTASPDAPNPSPETVA